MKNNDERAWPPLPSVFDEYIHMLAPRDLWKYGYRLKKGMRYRPYSLAEIKDRIEDGTVVRLEKRPPKAEKVVEVPQPVIPPPRTLTPEREKEIAENRKELQEWSKKVHEKSQNEQIIRRTFHAHLPAERSMPEFDGIDDKLIEEECRGWVGEFIWNSRTRTLKMDLGVKVVLEKRKRPKVPIADLAASAGEKPAPKKSTMLDDEKTKAVREYIEKAKARLNK